MSNKELSPFDQIETDHSEIVAAPNAEPLKWSDFAKKNLLAGDPITAQELVNREFDILRAKRFDSSFEGQDHAWYCVVRPTDTGEVFSVTLGGQAVVEVLDAFANAGITNPLRVKLGYHDGGKFNGYYTFEM